jgi:predicted site-specific integrase-resolvase
MNLTERTHALGIRVATAYRWWREGALGCAQQDAGLRAMARAGPCGGMG